MKSGLASGSKFPIGTTTVTWEAMDACDNTSEESFDVVVNAASTTSELTVTPTSQQYSDMVTLKVVITNGYSLCGADAATGVNFYIGTQLMNATPVAFNQVVSTTNMAAEITVPLLEPTPDPVYGAGVMQPGSKTVSAILVGTSTLYSVSNPTDKNLTITAENSDVEYIGANDLSTGSLTGTTATTTLRALVRDITAYNSTSDPNGGDIRNAFVKFSVTGGTSDCPSTWFPVNLMGSDPKIGVVEIPCKFTIGTDNTVTYKITVEVGGPDGYYTATADEASLNVYKPDGKDFITGGGTVSGATAQLNIPGAPTVKVDANRKVNFGFSIKWNKSVKNTQGMFNLIFRGTDGNMYQIKATSLGSTLGINSTNPCSQKASFNSKANLNNLTSGTTIGGLSLFVTMTDNGSPGIGKDLIKVELWSGTTLIFATYITPVSETLLTGGNIMVHSGVKCTIKSGTIGIEEIATAIVPDIEFADLKVYPNPFSEKLRFEFVSPESVNARIDLYDMTGRMVKTIFEQPIEGGVNYEAEFRPEAIISGMYIYRVTMGEAIYNGKVTLKK